MKKQPYTLTSIIAVIFCLCTSSCKKEPDGKTPDFEPVKEWTESFLGKRKEFIYDYFQKENVEASTWKYEGNDELLLISKFHEMELSSYFLGESVILTSLEYSAG